MGGAGSAALYHAAKAGIQAVGFEQFQVGHTRGSSHGHSRIIRYTYPDPLYTSLMAEAYPLWEALERDLDMGAGNLFARTGGLYFGPETNTEMQAVTQTLREVGLPHETLTQEECQRRHPALCLRPGEVAHFQPESGFLRAGECVQAHAHLAVRAGAELREDAEVTAICQQAGGGVLVHRANGRNEIFDRVIVTAGPWLTALFADLNLPLVVTKQQITYLPIVGDKADFEPGRLPVWIDAQTHWYGFPQDGQIKGVKLARHAPGPVTNPEEPGRIPDSSANEDAARYAAKRFPGLGATPTHAQVCLYTNTPDEDFIIDNPSGCPDVLLVSGCSGHGFKFTSLLGKIAADWARGLGYERDLSRFSLARFAATPNSP